MRTGDKESRRFRINLRALRNVIIIVAAAVAALCVYLWNNYNAQQQKLRQLERSFYSVYPDSGDVVLRIMGSGQVSPSDSVDVITPASGTLLGFTVNEGDRVEKGQKLGVIKKNTDTLEREIESLENAIDQARLQVNGYEAGYAERSIKAPIDGRVKSIFAKAGEEATATMRTFGYLALISTERKMVSAFTPTDGVILTEGDLISAALPDGTVSEARVIKGNNAYAYSDGDGLEVSAEPDSQPSPTPEPEWAGLDQLLEELTGGGQALQGAEPYADYSQCLIEIDRDDLAIDSKIVIMDAMGIKIGDGELSLSNYVYVSGSGVISKINVSENKMVSRGDRLFTLSSADISRAIEAVNMQIDQNTAILERKIEELERTEEALVSPASGIITQIGVRSGNDIYANRSVAVVMVTKGLEALVSVDELDILRVFPGQSALITADAMPDEPFSGTVTHISDIGTPGTYAGGVATFDVKVALDAPEQLKVGMSVNVDIEVEARRDVMRIPVAALRYTSSGCSVLMASFLLDDEGLPNPSGLQMLTSELDGIDHEVFERHLRPVEVGLINEDYAEIISGLTYDDEILVESGASTLIDFLLGT